MTANKLIQALTSGAHREPAHTDPSLTDAVFVEKLASAVEFINENFDSLPVSVGAVQAFQKKADAEPGAGAPVTDLAARLRERLHAKLQSRQAAEPDDQTTENVLGQLLRLRASAPAAEPAEEAPPADLPEETEPDQSGEVVTERAAQADLSLAEVLAGALQANELGEGVQTERPKTASVRGTEGQTARKAAVESLKKGLMAKFGKEA